MVLLHCLALMCNPTTIRNLQTNHIISTLIQIKARLTRALVTLHYITNFIVAIIQLVPLHHHQTYIDNLNHIMHIAVPALHTYNFTTTILMVTRVFRYFYCACMLTVTAELTLKLAYVTLCDFAWHLRDRRLVWAAECTGRDSTVRGRTVVCEVDSGSSEAPAWDTYLLNKACL